ncbi:MAG: hypothetical protein PUG48_10290 [Clostridia bacterium]|nr:hypothetical protein [Clostridia bacterium]
MECILFQNINKNTIFYAVYNTEVEIPDESDALCEIRKNFFETGKKLKNRNTVKTNADTFRFSYVIEDGHILKWKKLQGNQQIERVVETPDGYYVETDDFAKRPIKRTYYNCHHIWQKSEFYSLNDRFTPIYVLTPDFEEDKPVIIRKTKNGYTETLYPFNITLDKSLTEKLNILTNEPQIFCKTSSGNFYFCTKSDYDERKQALEKMLKRENTVIFDEPVFESAKEPSAFVVDSEKLDMKNDENKKQGFNLSDSEEIHINSESVNTETEVNKPFGNKEKTTSEELLSQLDSMLENSKTDYSENTDTIKEMIVEDKEKEKDESTQPESAEENDTKIPTPSFVYEQGEMPAPRETTCIFASECPYETIEKQIIESGGRQYFYFGELSDNKRNGRGRTAMKNGETAYEGDYTDDKRDGFGVYYYKSGKLCYTGNWEKNKRNGLGVAFSPLDSSAYIGEWKDDTSVGIGASFDKKGKLLYLGTIENGKKDGAGVTFDERKNTFFVGKYKDGKFLGTGTQFAKDGTMLYVGEYMSNTRTGTGTEYNPDGTVKYTGRWFNDVYDGEGTLSLDDGGKLSGNFKNGKAFGKCTFTDKNGKVVYIGSFVDNIYNGTGRLFFDNGGYAEGRFVDGEPTGIFNEYDSDKKLVYCGEWTDMHRNGRGIEYNDGEKIYEGDFKNSVYSGDGKFFENGKLVYTGTFSDGKKDGFGVEFKDDKMLYQGMWKNGFYGGCGIIYENGSAKFVGEFSDGKKNGRINEISNTNIIRKCLYKDDELIYVCEYSDDGSLLYYGNIKDGQKNGMGCSFIPYCEKQFEGIFKNNEPLKPMKVCLKELPELPECKELENTEYELFRKAPDYIIEKNIADGIFTGKLKDGKPEGKGTILYSDHRYTGMFADGKPDGEGVIYLRDGREIRGRFSPEPFTDCETVIMNSITYYKSSIIHNS